MAWASGGFVDFSWAGELGSLDSSKSGGTLALGSGSLGSVGLALGPSGASGDCSGDWIGLVLADGVMLGVGELLGDCGAVGAVVGSGDLLGFGVGEGAKVGEPLVLSLGSGSSLGLGDGEGEDDGLAVGDFEGVGEGSSVESCVGFAVGDFEGFSVGLVDGFAVGDAEGAGVFFGVGSGAGSGTTGVSSFGTTTSGFCSFLEGRSGWPLGALRASTVSRVESISAGPWPGIRGRYNRGSLQRPLTSTSKCTWQPVELPVVPDKAITSPCCTRCPKATSSFELWL